MADADEARQARMTIDLSGEQVVLERVHHREALGAPFDMVVDVISQLGEIAMLQHLGKPVAVHVYEDGKLMRHFHGIISTAELTRDTTAGHHYRLSCVPFTEFMSHNSNMRIFQDLSVPDIIKKVLDDAGQTNHTEKLVKHYPARTYCVQYRESDFGFIHRLMEEEGIYFYFAHEAAKHVLVMCDSPRSHAAGTPDKLTFNPTARTVYNHGSAERHGDKYFMNKFEERVQSGAEQKVTLRAFDFEKPERPVHADATGAKHHPGDAQEIYDYPNGFVDETRGAELSQIRLETGRAGRESYLGHAQATSLVVGATMSMLKHPTERLNQSYMIVSTSTTITSEQYFSDNSAGAHEEIGVLFYMMPAATPFHMGNTTPKPKVDGLETAIVSGPDGEEIYTDSYGRVKVRFHWDRSDSAGEKTTCWIRVAQFGNLGSLILPRVGQEVMVSFLHGDPDYPIITGWVFNKDLMPVYNLPDNKTRSLWRTKRYGQTGQYPNAKTLDTGAPGANELRFEDKGGSEEVFLHAERDMNTRIRFQETHYVGQNQTLNVGYDRTVTVQNDENYTVDQNQSITVKGAQTEKVTKDRTTTIDQGNDSLTLNQGNQTIDVKIGSISIKADAGKIEIEAMESITLKVGKSTVTIDPTSLQFKAMMIDSEATLQQEIKSPQMSMEGSIMTTIKGGVVMIN